MTSRRLIFSIAILATAILFFTLGVIHSRRTDAASRASYDAKLDAIRSEVRSELGQTHSADAATPAGTSGQVPAKGEAGYTVPGGSGRARMVAEIKEQLQAEMGLLPVHLLRERRSSFVELYSYYNLGKTHYRTAG